MKQGTSPIPCAVCGKLLDRRATVPAAAIRPSILAEIRKDHPDIVDADRICHRDLSRYRVAHVENLLTTEKGELTTLETDVVNSLRDHELMAVDAQSEFGGQATFGERMADRIAAFGGSWLFLTAFFVFIVLWMTTNILVLATRPFDPYPFILLNLILSCLAAIQAPVIMMSQNRQEAKDRLRGEYDYRVNLKAELEIRHLHEKMDHLLTQQWERLVEIQQVQIELLQELRGNHRPQR
jgi:uncharacterized membrane protein